jgi:hypothetical protein
MKKFLKYFLIFIIIALIGSQFVRPDRFTTAEVTSDDITKKLQVPQNVQDIFKRSCFDCHSNHTVWPWYTNVSPVSWLVADDVTKGRKKMNMSEWGKMSQSKQEKKLQDICDQITDGTMPLDKYLLIHKDAVLSQQEKDAICKWVTSLVGQDDDKSDTKDNKKDTK